MSLCGCTLFNQGDGGVNETLISEHIPEKTNVIGYRGIENVIAFNTSIPLPEDYRSNQLEIPIGYLIYEINDFWVYTPQSRDLVKPESQEFQNPCSFLHATHCPLSCRHPMVQLPWALIRQNQSRCTLPSFVMCPTCRPHE